MSRRHVSLLARRRRRARRRSTARAIVTLAAGFAAGLWLGLRLLDEIAPVQPRLPEVAAAPVSARPRRVEPEPPPPPPPPNLPPELLATLPPSVRLGIDPAGLAADADRVSERVDWQEEGGPRGPLEIEYTLDAALTRRVGEILRPVELGHVVVLDPSDGRVLAYASTEPQQFPATRPYPTASLMKVVTAAAVLEQAPEVTQRPCRFVGSPYYLTQHLLDPPQRGHTATFVQALAMSNNQCFAQLAVHELGSLAVIDAMDRLGLLEPPGPGHAPGEVDPVRDRLELGRLGSGLAGSRISPLAAARLAAVLASGQVVTPWWIARARDANGNELVVPPADAPRPALRPGVSRALRTMMVETTVRGTARRAFRGRDGRALLDPISVAGKTGSLNGKDPDGHYEWFIGVAPAEQPVVAIAALVVNRGKWRRSASQVAADVLQSVFCREGECRVEAADRRTVAVPSGPG